MAHPVSKYKPRIWSARQGRFFWGLNIMPENLWGMTALDAHKLWSEAHRWVNYRNKRDRLCERA